MTAGDHPLIVVCGPTGSGKSALAITVAERFSGEVVNCDSVQVYRRFNIGTAKNTEAEQRGVPHHLVDVAEPLDVFTAGDYSRLARQAIGDISARGRLPVIAGGTGFYLRALLQGLFNGPPRNDVLRERLRLRDIRRPGSLHRLLRRWDAVSAQRIHVNDTNKITRALEVILTEKQSLTDLFERGRDPLLGYRILELGLAPPRAGLYERLDQRAELMYERGLVEETRELLERYPASAKPFESLGYAQAAAYIKRKISIERAIADTKMFTRRYAKRQLTWFRREPGIEWLSGYGDDASLQQTAIERVRGFLEIS